MPDIELKDFLGEWKDTMGNGVQVDWASADRQLDVVLTRSNGNIVRLNVRQLNSGKFTCGHFDLDTVNSNPARIIWLCKKGKGGNPSTWLRPGDKEDTRRSKSGQSWGDSGWGGKRERAGERWNDRSAAGASWEDNAWRDDGSGGRHCWNNGAPRRSDFASGEATSSSWKGRGGEDDCLSEAADEPDDWDGHGEADAWQPEDAPHCQDDVAPRRLPVTPPRYPRVIAARRRTEPNPPPLDQGHHFPSSSVLPPQSQPFVEREGGSFPSGSFPPPPSHPREACPQFFPPPNPPPHVADAAPFFPPQLPLPAPHAQEWVGFNHLSGGPRPLEVPVFPPPVGAPPGQPPVFPGPPLGGAPGITPPLFSGLSQGMSGGDFWLPRPTTNAMPQFPPPAHDEVDDPLDDRRGGGSGSRSPSCESGKTVVGLPLGDQGGSCQDERENALSVMCSSVTPGAWVPPSAGAALAFPPPCPSPAIAGSGVNGAVVAVDPFDQCNWRYRIEEMYRHFNPAKLEDLDRIFDKYNGQEADLYDALCTKYGPLPQPQDPRLAHSHAMPPHAEAECVQLRVQQPQQPLQVVAQAVQEPAHRPAKPLPRPRQIQVPLDPEQQRRLRLQQKVEQQMQELLQPESVVELEVPAEVANGRAAEEVCAEAVVLNGSAAAEVFADAVEPNGALQERLREALGAVVPNGSAEEVLAQAVEPNGALQDRLREALGALAHSHLLNDAQVPHVLNEAQVQQEEPQSQRIVGGAPVSAPVFTSMFEEEEADEVDEDQRLVDDGYGGEILLPPRTLDIETSPYGSDEDEEGLGQLKRRKVGPDSSGFYFG